jgi:hypothetical protein
MQSVYLTNSAADLAPYGFAGSAESLRVHFLGLPQQAAVTSTAAPALPFAYAPGAPMAMPGYPPGVPGYVPGMMPGMMPGAYPGYPSMMPGYPPGYPPPGM